jgi:hypothetical protein
MIFRLLFITLYILQYTFFSNGQNVQTMHPQDSCVPGSASLHCPANYIIVVRSAFYGVAQTDGKCSYSNGDCIADAMNIVSCVTDSVQCLVYGTRKKLPECNDAYNSYIHVEYDCVPMSMDDPIKEYNVCQNGSEITTDHGILRSPGYPTQFQTTTAECFRLIHVPDNKIVRLWLSDLYIGSTSTNCDKDHVIVVDGLQQYRHCGLVRFSYPYLCSSTIKIQYFVTTDLPQYRGLRMYFEIFDRPENDGCPDPDATTTIDPGITTTVPSYVDLGIASPIQSFQLCKGKLLNLSNIK